MDQQIDIFNEYLSSSTKNSIKDCRILAERFQSDFISLYFFLWIYPNYSPEETREFGFPYSQKKELLMELKGKREKPTPELLPLSDDFEEALFGSVLQKKS